MPVSIEYKLTGAGWAQCRVQIGDAEARLTASYLSDPLDNLLEAMRLLLSGVTEVHTSFDEEPGEYRWVMRLAGPGRVSVAILWFDELWSDRPDEKGEAILTAECRLRTLAGAVLAAAQAVFREHGDEGYRTEWSGDPFPSERMDRVKNLLDFGAGAE